jgi:SM-20-related protein
LSERDVERLGSEGFVLGHGFLGDALALAAHDEAKALLAAGAFQRAGVRRGGDHRLDDEVRGDSITWIEEGAPGALGQVFQRFDELRLQLNELAWLGLRRTELQLAHYPSNGAGYQKHVDAFPGSDNRRMTALVYLNPAWQPAHGGELALHPEPVRLVAPTLDTFVVFRSELIEHEVRPSFADRFAIAAWYSAR